MNESTRRDFFKSSAFCAALAMGASKRALGIDPIGRKRPSHLKLSIAAYSYRQYLTSKPPKMTMFDFVDLAAELGLDAVEPTSYYFPEDLTVEYLHKLKHHAFIRGLDISGTAIRNDFCLPPGPEREKDLEHVRTWIDRASELDAQVIRVFGGTIPKGESEEVAVGRVIEGLNAVLPYAEKKGVMLALENHGGITATPGQLLKLVEPIKSSYFGVNLDTGNFRTDDPYADLAKLAPYAVNVQVKTEISPRGKKKEDADLARLVSILREAKYSGYVVLEYEAAEDPLKAIPGHIKTLRSLIG